MSNADEARLSTPSGGAAVEPDIFVGDASFHDLLVPNHGSILKPKHSAFVAHSSVLENIDIDSLAAAIRHPGRCCAETNEPIYIAHDDDPTEGELIHIDDAVRLEVTPAHVFSVAEITLKRPIGDEQSIKKDVTRSAERYNCFVADVTLVDSYGDDGSTLLSDLGAMGAIQEEIERVTAEDRANRRFLQIRLATDGPARVGTIIAAARDVVAIVRAIEAGYPLTASSIVDLVESGYANLLIDCGESETLEVKSIGYAIDAEVGRVAHAAKIELGQDVSRFANGSQEGVLLVGLETKRVNGEDVITSARGAKLMPDATERYRAIIDAFVYPTIEGLKVAVTPIDQRRSVLTILIPKQPEEYKPFLVHGAIIGDRVEGAFISIVRRRGEGSIAITASQIHATLAAGRHFFGAAGSLRRVKNFEPKATMVGNTCDA